MTEPTIQALGIGLASAAQILKSLKEMVSGDARAQVSTLYDVILAAQTSAMESNLKQSQMVDRIRDLESEIADMKAWDAEKERYKLVAPFTAGALYALKKEHSNGEPPHYICANCYQRGEKGFLQLTEDKNGYTFLSCVCKASVATGYRGTPTAKYAEDVHIKS